MHDGAHPRITARRWIAAAAGLFVCNQTGIALTAPLVTHAPLLLIALSPLGRNFLLASQVTPLLTFTLVGASRRALGSLVGYKLGVAYGQRALSALEGRSPRLGRLARMFERLFQRADLPMAFLVPRGTALLAGAAGMDLRVYMAASTAGHAFWAVVTYKLGDWLSGYLQPVLAFIETHMPEVTAGFIALVVVQVLYHRLRSRGRSTLEQGPPV